MQCPKCGFEQPEAPSCAKCGVVFRKLAAPAPDAPASPAPAPAPAPAPRYVATPSERTGGGLARIAAASAGLVVVALLWRFGLSVGGGGDVPPGAYRSEAHQYAVAADPAWIQLTAANYDAVIDQYAGKLPPELRAFAGGAKGIDVGFLKLDDEFTPSVNVVVVDREPPPIDAASATEGAAEIAKGFGERLKTYTQESARIVEVDGIASLEIVSRTTLSVKVADAEYETQEGIVPGSVIYGAEITPAEYRDYELRFVQTLVPGRGRAYILTATALDSQWAELAPAFDAVRASFRVVERPKRGSAAMNGALQGGLLAAGLGLLVFAVTGLFERG